MKYFELTFDITPYDEAAGDVLAALLAEAGCETFLPTATGIKAYVQQALYDEAAIRAVIDDFPFPGTAVRFTLTEAPDENWNATWEASHHFEPIDLPDGQQLTIIPRQAFGSGEHATTRMMLTLLADTLRDVPITASDSEGLTVIDAGCGTGVLGIAALKLGASRVFAYDIDEWSVRNAIDNFALNGLSAQRCTLATSQSSEFNVSSADFCRDSAIQASLMALAAPEVQSPKPKVQSSKLKVQSSKPKVQSSKFKVQSSKFKVQCPTLIALGDATTALPVAPRADIFLANINRNILLADLPAFVAKLKPGAHLLLSGFLEDDIEPLTQCATALGLTLQETRADNEWRALIFNNGLEFRV